MPCLAKRPSTAQRVLQNLLIGSRSHPRAMLDRCLASESCQSLSALRCSQSAARAGAAPAPLQHGGPLSSSQSSQSSTTRVDANGLTCKTNLRCEAGYGAASEQQEQKWSTQGDFLTLCQKISNFFSFFVASLVMISDNHQLMVANANKVRSSLAPN